MTIQLLKHWHIPLWTSLLSASLCGENYDVVDAHSPASLSNINQQLNLSSLLVSSELEEEEDKQKEITIVGLPYCIEDVQKRNSYIHKRAATFAKKRHSTQKINRKTHSELPKQIRKAKDHYEKGLFYHHHGNYKGAIIEFSAALKGYRRQGEVTSEVIIVLSALGDAWQGCRKLEHARTYHLKALSTLHLLSHKTRLSYPTEMIKEYIALGLIDSSLSIFSKAIEWYKQAYRVVAKQPQNTLNARFKLYSLIANLCLRDENFNEAITYYQQCISMLQSSSWALEPLKKLHILYGLCLAYYNIDDLPKSIAYGLQALSILSRNPQISRQQEVEVLETLGKSYYEQEAFAQALNYFMQAATIFKPLTKSDQRYLALLYSSLGDTLYAQQDLPQAAQWYIKALGVYVKKSAQDLTSSDIKLLLAEVYVEQELFEEALHYYYRAYRRYRQVLGKNCAKAASVERKIGLLQLRNQSIPHGLNHLQSALRIYKKLALQDPNKENLIIAYKDLSIAHATDNNYLAAFQYLEKALQVQKTHLENTDPAIIETYAEITDLCKSASDIVKALFYYREAVAFLKKACQSKECKEQTRQEYQILIEKAKKEIENLNSINAQQELAQPNCLIQCLQKLCC